jgi:hypothetical protein
MGRLFFYNLFLSCLFCNHSLDGHKKSALLEHFLRRMDLMI